MADILLDEQGNPTTPGAGTLIIYPDNTASMPAFKNDAGRSGLMGGSTFNASIANQSISAADTYLTDSDLLIPSFGLQARSMFRWVISVSKTAASTATPVYNIRIGANRTTGDTARLAITGPAQTAVADVAIITIQVLVRSVGASGVLQGTVSINHNGAAAGFCNNDASAVEATAAGFDNSNLAGQYIGISINNGASAAWTVTQVRAEAMW